MKTDLMSELKLLQLLAELGKEGLVLPDHHTGSTNQIKNPRNLTKQFKKSESRIHVMRIRIHPSAVVL
jgi:hypothetical protein